MGTRADFYVGRGPNAEWLGSINYDGMPQRKLKRVTHNDDGVPVSITRCTDEAQYRIAVRDFLVNRSDGQLAAFGSTRTTPNGGGWAYSFKHGRKGNPRGTVFASNFGGAWFNVDRRAAPDKRHHPAILPSVGAQEAGQGTAVTHT
jgi:hypothetical protein